MSDTAQDARDIRERPQPFRGWLVLGVLTCAILATFAFLSWRDLQNRYAMAERQAHDAVWFVGRNVSEKLHIYDLQMEVLAQAVEHSGMRDLDNPDMWALIQHIMKSTPFIRGIGIYDDKGDLAQHSERRGGGGINIADREYHARARTQPGLGTFIAHPVQSRVYNDLVVALVHPLRAPDGTFMGIATMAVRPEALDLSGGLFSLQTGSTVSVHLRDGITLFRAPMDRALIGTDLSGTPLFSKTLAQAPVGVTRGNSLDCPKGQTCIQAYRVLGDWPLVVTASIQGSRIIKEWRTDWTRNGLLVGLALVGFCWLAFIAQRQTTQRLQAELEFSRQELAGRVAAEEELRRWATTDALTGLNNRRHFMEQAEREIQRAQRHFRPLSVLIFDVDHFKTINDRFGHGVGDRALRLIADTACTSLRDSDIVGRLGGEEFGVLLPETDITGAIDLAERLRTDINRLLVPAEDSPQLLSISVGAADLTPEDQTIDALLARADRALYDAKNSGRNRVAAR